ncbi:T9SS type A sorting domain-containing protein [Lutibacter sp. Hel_I_33_5]|uniref:T9SS type A sorting domain-containing protein n=1 Tax=Lutibacter sp. Hel_I_33_5 TaxID=1566289 RepID=UPI0011A20106|nr:T9SS type A sorting domain-containing protein [Lutibacter sp. Hel_I_33_5]
MGISFSEGKTFEIETGFDSKKIEIKDSDIYFQFTEDGDKLVIAGVQELTDTLEVPIVIKIDSSEETYLMLDDIENINRKIFIKDSQTNLTHDLSSPLTLNLPEGTYENRFYITFGETPLNVENNVLSNKLQFYIDENSNEIVVRKNSKETVTIHSLKGFNLLGQELFYWKNDTPKNNESRIGIEKLSNGLYILKLKTDKGMISKSFLISKK